MTIFTHSLGRRPKKMMDRPSRTLMASGGNEPVLDSGGGGNNSVFAAAFIRSLKEANKEAFTAEEIFPQIKEIVAGKSEQVPEYSDIRSSGHEGGDFVFKLARLGIEPRKLEEAEKEKGAQIKKELQKLEAEQARLETERKQMEERMKLDKERAQVAVEKALWEAKKKEAEELIAKQQETLKKWEEERKKLEEKQNQEKAPAGKEVRKPGLPKALMELSSILPEYEISQPAPSDPPEVKELLGVWTGYWSGQLASVLIITGIDIYKKKATVIYAVGDSPYTKKGFNMINAEFIPGENPVIKIGRDNLPKIEFVLRKNNLWGQKKSDGNSWLTLTIIMTKAQ